MLLRSRWKPRCHYCAYRRSLSSFKPTRDPTAARPNQKCDPYNQGGKPMQHNQIQSLRSTINAKWVVDEDHTSLVRTFYHPDFLSGARFVHKIAAVGEVNAHYPELRLDRVIRKRSWAVETTIRCQTKVLQGLSTHDFHLAMLIDVEVMRPDVLSLLEKEEENEDNYV